MIRLQAPQQLFMAMESGSPAPGPLQTVQAMLQQAIEVEFATLPPYLYALYSIRPGTNPKAAALIKSVALQEMIHLSLASNILNALGGNPVIKAPEYPSSIAGDIGEQPDGSQLILHLYPFSLQAMEQAMAIEQPAHPPAFCPVPGAPPDPLPGPGPTGLTIGQFYELIDTMQKALPDDAWHVKRNQITDKQFFPGQLFAVNNSADASAAIASIISEGEGSETNPLDFQDELAHYYRFGEIYHNAELTNYDGVFSFGAPLGVDFTSAGVYPAIPDPSTYTFTPGSQAYLAQLKCNQAFTSMVGALNQAVSGTHGALGQAVQFMFQLRLSALEAFTVPLEDGVSVAGPAFQII